MTEAPKRISVKRTQGYESNWWGVVTDPFDESGVEYVRADEIERLQAELREAREAMTSARESLYSLTHLLLPDEPGFEKAVDGLEELDAFLAK